MKYSSSTGHDLSGLLETTQCRRGRVRSIWQDRSNSPPRWTTKRPFVFLRFYAQANLQQVPNVLKVGRVFLLYPSIRFFGNLPSDDTQIVLRCSFRTHKLESCSCSLITWFRPVVHSLYFQMNCSTSRPFPLVGVTWHMAQTAVG